MVTTKPSRPRGAAPAPRLDGPSQVLTGNVGDGCLVGRSKGDQGGAGRASAGMLLAKLLQDPGVFGKERGGGEGRASPGKFPVRGEGAAPGSNGWVKVVLVGGGRRGRAAGMVSFQKFVPPPCQPAAAASGCELRRLHPPKGTTTWSRAQDGLGQHQ